MAIIQCVNSFFWVVV